MAKAKPFDAAEYLDSPEMIAAYLNEAFECEDASAIAVAIGTVARQAPPLQEVCDRGDVC
ncbi:putative addiction module antidote protein [Bradyrhizobium sp. AZCC 1719]|uniref:helix-turn-helix domain-containing transcriptional regulator n=1 Tax=Bradyrhizobium sp. AZCC 1719 TaxID=3117028 RepID=UPI002FEF1716